MYLLTFISSAFLLYVSGKYKRNKYFSAFMVILALLIPSILAGLRDYNIGYDVLLYGNYWFEKACSYGSMIGYLNKAREYSVGIGYAAVNFLSSRISHDPHVFYFNYELLHMVLLYFGLKPFKDKISIPFAFLVYYFMWYNLSLNILRQSMALIIVFFSYQFVVNKKPVWFALCIFIAMTFHNTAIIGVILYIISFSLQSRVAKLFKLIVVFASGVVILFYKQVFEILASMSIFSTSRYGHYMEDSLAGGRYIRIVFWLFIAALVIWRGRQCNRIWDHSKVINFWIIISLVMSLVMFVASSTVIRAAYYFDIIAVISIPFITENLGVREKVLGNKIQYVITIVPIILYWFLTFIVRNGAQTFPYVFYFAATGTSS